MRKLLQLQIVGSTQKFFQRERETSNIKTGIDADEDNLCKFFKKKLMDEANSIYWPLDLMNAPAFIDKALKPTI
jgi:hypothetical protein